MLAGPVDLVLEGLLLLRADEVDAIENLGELRDTVSGMLRAAGYGFLELVAFLASALNDAVQGLLAVLLGGRLLVGDLGVEPSRSCLLGLLALVGSGETLLGCGGSLGFLGDVGLAELSSLFKLLLDIFEGWCGRVQLGLLSVEALSDLGWREGLPERNFDHDLFGGILHLV